MNTFLKTILNAFSLQFALILIAFPIFIHWGLPLSVASWIGTIIFSPFLTLFLLLSSLIFLTELLSIPNTYICTGLEYTTNIWQFFLSFSSEHWLIGFAKPPSIFLIMIPIITLFAITHKKLQTPKKRLFALVSIFACTTIILKLYPYTKTPQVTPVECGKKDLYIITHPSQTIVFDPSVLARKTTIESWILFTLSSELLRQTGKLNINHFILRTCSNRALKTLEKIHTIIPIEHIYIPFSHALTTKDNPLFLSLQEKIEQKGGTITCIESSYSFMVDLSVQIEIKNKGAKLQLDTNINGKIDQCT